MNIAIIGAGIGGLTTALFLQKLGISVHVYEQAKEFKPIGAGIMLAHNAMQVFDKLGLNEDIVALSHTLHKLNITHSDLRIISAIDNKLFDQKFSVNHVAIQRSALQKLLLDRLSSEYIYLNKKLITIQQGKKATLTFSDGLNAEYDAVIAADGVHSIVRNILFPDSLLRDANQICWRGIATIELPSNYTHELNEAWGLGTRFGFVQISKQQVYWYALCNKDCLSQSTDLKALFSGYHLIVQNIIANTDELSLIKNDIKDLKPLTQWYKNKVVLIGDAAHATTPNMGQGACQAIEDAYVLSTVLDRYPINEAFKKYQEVRINKAHNVVNMSWNIGKISHIESRFFAGIRNFLMSKMPVRLNSYELEKILRL